MLEPSKSTQIADRYRLTRKLGEGGMGSVWAAHDEKLRRDVAIKLVTERISDSATALTRFEREAMAVARLRSPYIAQVYDYGVEEGSPYIIMELLDGEDLKALLTRERRLTIEGSARIVVSVAKALHAAHETGIIHRDLKPANVFMARDHGEEVVKVFDFGVAKALNDLADDGDTTAEGVLLGTPRYMSPEQAHGAKLVDHRSDLWSLGVIAYLCVCGRLPFVAVGSGHLLVKICTEEPPAPSQLIAHLPPEVDAFFARALAKDPDERFQSARELGEAFVGLADESMSSFARGVGGATPSWGGLASPPSEPSYSGLSITGDDVSVEGAAADDETSVETPSARGPMTSSVGTLGPATTSLEGSRGWLGSRGARLGLVFVAIAVVAALAIVVTTRDPSTAAPMPAAQPAGSSASASATSRIDAAAAVSNQPTAVAAIASASAAASSAVAPPPDRVAKPQRRATSTPAAATSAAGSAKPTPPPPPTSSGAGDGLDLFDKRF